MYLKAPSLERFCRENRFSRAWRLIIDKNTAIFLIYAWIGCNSAKFGHLYAAAPTRPVSLQICLRFVGFFPLFLYDYFTGKNC